MPGQPGIERLCEWCGGPIPSYKRRDAVFCSKRHQNSHTKARKKREQEGVISPRSEYVDGYTDSRGRSWLPDLGGYAKADTPETAGSPDASSSDAAPLAASQRIASTRFARLLKSQQAEEAERPIVLPSEQELQHRNPGVKLATIRDRELDRLELQRDRATIARAESQGWQPMDRLHGDQAAQRDAFAARARASRARNRHPQDSQRAQLPQGYQPLTDWQAVSTPAEIDPRSFGRRLPARYLNT